jgi:urease accessory protein
VRAVARVVAEGDGRGGTRLTCLRSEAPLVLRATPGAVYLVGGAAGPLGGDDLTVEVEVGSGATLTVRTAAASVALPGPGTGPSRLRVRARVGAGARLHWLPEPVVAAHGCDHRMEATLDVAAAGRLVWREEVLLGRHREPSGSVTTRLAVDVAGEPLLRHELALGPAHPGCGGPAIVAGARAVGSVLVVDPAWRDRAPPGALLGSGAVVLALEGPGALVLALADGAVALRRSLDAGTERALAGSRDATRT